MLVVLVKGSVNLWIQLEALMDPILNVCRSELSITYFSQIFFSCSASVFVVAKTFFHSNQKRIKISLLTQAHFLEQCIKQFPTMLLFFSDAYKV